jgi:hypothetical protein
MVLVTIQTSGRGWTQGSHANRCDKRKQFTPQPLDLSEKSF